MVTLLGLIVCLLVPAVGQVAENGEVVIAVVRDGPAPGEDVVSLIEEELALHLPRGMAASFKVDPAFDAGWDPDRINMALEKALQDPESDLVLVTGSLGTAPSGWSSTSRSSAPICSAQIFFRCRRQATTDHRSKTWPIWCSPIAPPAT
jgi:hypothetical protein